MLLEAGANPNSRGRGLNLLFTTTIFDHPDIVKALLEAGAGVNGVEDVPVGGLTPMHCPAESRHADIVGISIAIGAQIDTCTTKGHTPLHQAALNCHVEVIKLLSNAGAGIEIKSQIWEMPLHVAMYNRYREAARAIWQADGSFTALVTIGEDKSTQHFLQSRMHS